MSTRPGFALSRPCHAASADADPDAWAEWQARIDAARAAAVRGDAGPGAAGGDLRGEADGETAGQCAKRV